MLHSTVMAADMDTLCVNIAMSFPYSNIMESIIYLQINRVKTINGKNAVTMRPPKTMQ